MSLAPAFDRTWLGILLVLSATIFALGVAVERSTVHTDSHAAVVSSSPEGSPGHVEGAGESGSGSTSETIFGLNPESTGLVVAAIVVSLALALAVWLWDLPALLLLILAFGLGAAVFDAREVVHQAQESRGTLAFLATITAILHLGVVVVAGRVWQQSSRKSTAATHSA